MSEQIGNSNGNPNATFSGSGSNAASIAESVAESGPDFDALRAACEARLNGSGQLAGKSCTGRNNQPRSSILKTAYLSACSLHCIIKCKTI